MLLYKPLRAAFLTYDVLRLAALAFLFAFFSPLGGAVYGGIFPYLVYLTSNALFPLMTLFLFLRFEEYRNYLPLYLAGKLIAVITFYVWVAVSFRTAMREPLFGLDPESFYQGLVLLCGAFVLSIADLVSIFGGAFLLRRIQSLRPEAASPPGYGAPRQAAPIRDASMDGTLERGAPAENQTAAAIPKTGETGGY